jgi:hypothetical protein
VSEGTGPRLAEADKGGLLEGCLNDSRDASRTVDCLTLL